MVDNHQDAMGDRHNGALLSLACGQAAKPGRQRGSLSVGSSPGCLAETATQPCTTFVWLARQPFAGTLVVAGTNARPAGQMLSRGKLVHIRPNLGNEVRGGYLFNPRNSGTKSEGLLVFSDLLLDLPIELGKLRFQKL